MTRRDIIIIAALINAGLLAILFMMAMNSDDDKVSDPVEIGQTIEIKATELPIATEVTLAAVAPVPTSTIPAPTGDEVDNALKEFGATTTPPAQTDSEEQRTVEEQDEECLDEEKEEKPVEKVVPKTASKKGKMVEITVKSGDTLDKIARANNTTVTAIKEVNELTKDRLKIGQVLTVPVGVKKIKHSDAPKKIAFNDSKEKKEPKEEVAEADAQYYTVKNGDNPWKIAKKFHIKVSELLRLNHMDEENARNLKIGDKIRVK